MAIYPNFVDDFKPPLTKSAQGIWVALLLLTLLAIVELGPSTTLEALLSEKVDGVSKVLVARPALVAMTVLAGSLSHWRSASLTLHICALPENRSRLCPISPSKRGAIFLGIEVSMCGVRQFPFSTMVSYSLHTL